MSNDGRAYGDASTLEALGYEPLSPPLPGEYSRLIELAEFPATAH
jgi:hypothetical protein